MRNFSLGAVATIALWKSAPVRVHFRLSVCRKSEFCQNGSTDRAVSWHRSIVRFILPCVIRKFGYLQNKGGLLFSGTKPWTWKNSTRHPHRTSLCESPRKMDGKLDRRHSWRKLTTPATVDGQFIRSTARLSAARCACGICVWNPAGPTRDPWTDAILARLGSLVPPTYSYLS